MKSKICGISDFETLKFLTNHPNPPQYIGFIVNYPKSKRFVQNDTLRKILTIDKRKSKYVAVLVKPDKKILERIKDLPFDYYQIYDSSANDVSAIKKNIKKR